MARINLEDIKSSKVNKNIWKAIRSSIREAFQTLWYGIICFFNKKAKLPKKIRDKFVNKKKKKHEDYDDLIDLPKKKKHKKHKKSKGKNAKDFEFSRISYA